MVLGPAGHGVWDRGDGGAGGWGGDGRVVCGIGAEGRVSVDDADRRVSDARGRGPGEFDGQVARRAFAETVPRRRIPGAVPGSGVLLGGGGDGGFCRGVVFAVEFFGAAGSVEGVVDGVVAVSGFGHECRWASPFLPPPFFPFFSPFNPLQYSPYSKLQGIR